MPRGVPLTLADLDRAAAAHASGQPWKCAAALVGCSRVALWRALARARAATGSNTGTVAGRDSPGVGAMVTLSAAPAPEADHGRALADAPQPGPR